MIVATAGHIDHGKTALIKALTGVDADRLPEEKKRGITVDLGFAYKRGANGLSLGYVDVPGHEKLVRIMRRRGIRSRTRSLQKETGSDERCGRWLPR